MKEKIAIFSVLAVVILCAPLAMMDTEADTSFEVTDQTGRTFQYDGPSEHFVSTGYAVTHTLYQLGVIDKIVATDQYGSKEYAESSQGDKTLGDLNAINLGSMFSNDCIDTFKTTLPQLVEKGVMNLDDTVILTTSSKIYDIRAELEKLGFTHVLIYKEFKTYDDIISMMETLSLTSKGVVDDRVSEMKRVATEISDATKDAVPAKALYVWYNSTGLAVGNTGIMSSMLEICNAEQIGLDTSIDKGYYGSDVDLIQLIEKNRDAIIFLNNSYLTAGHTIGEFRDKYLGGDTTIGIVAMGPLWNNYCIESMDGLREISKALYPDIFGESDLVDYGSNGESNIMLYLAVGVIVLVAIAGIAVYILKKP